MLQKLTGDAGRFYWINTDHIQSMEVLDGIENGYATTRLIFANGGNEMVKEKPEAIALGHNS